MLTQKENYFSCWTNYSELFHDKKTVIKMVIEK